MFVHSKMRTGIIKFIPLRICEDMCKTSVEAVNAKDVTNKKEFANRKRPTNC